VSLAILNLQSQRTKSTCFVLLMLTVSDCCHFNLMWSK